VKVRDNINISEYVSKISKIRMSQWMLLFHLLRELKMHQTTQKLHIRCFSFRGWHKNMAVCLEFTLVKVLLVKLLVLVKWVTLYNKVQFVNIS